MATTSPTMTLPSLSAGLTSSSDCQEPRSFQRKPAGTMAMPLGPLHDRIVDRGRRNLGIKVERQVEAGHVAGRRCRRRPPRRPRFRAGTSGRRPASRRRGTGRCRCSSRNCRWRDRTSPSPDRAFRRNATRRGRPPAVRDLDVAVAGFGLRRLDAEHHEPALQRGRHALLHRLPELRVGRNLMVGRDDQHQRVVAMRRERLQRRDRHRRGRVAADRLEDRAAAGQVERRDVGTHAVGMPLRGDQVDRRLAFRPRLQPAQRLHQHRAVAGKIVELLRIVLARQRPQPASRRRRS